MKITCQIIKGFFILRPCGRKVKLVCAECGKSLCKRCQAPNENRICNPCYLQKQNRTDEDYDDAWIHQRRQERYDSIDDNVRLSATALAADRLNDQDAKFFEPENQTDSDSADWGDDTDISAFDS